MSSIILSNPQTAPQTLTNANRQLVQVDPWNIHSALVLSTLALLITAEGEYGTPTTNIGLIHLLHVAPRHQLALWVVPLYWSGHWTCGLYTVHSLIRRPGGQRHVRLGVRQVSPALLEVSSRRCSERMCQEEQLYDRGVKCNKQML